MNRGYEIAVSLNPGPAYQVQTLEQVESWKFMEYDPPLVRKEASLISSILLDKGWKGVRVFNPKGHMTFDGRRNNG